jgi:putative transposase
MRIIKPLEAGNVYHIFNRGINGETIFKEERNYDYFLNKYQEYCSNILETYAYALLKNHFHLMVKVKEDVIVARRDGKGDVNLNASKQLSHFFNCYAQSYNKAYQRHGKLLEEPFKRILVDDAQYFTALIYYIHHNPQQHRFVKHFYDWKFTSYNALKSNTPGFISNENVIEWFGSTETFIKAHTKNDIQEIPFKLILE